MQVREGGRKEGRGGEGGRFPPLLHPIIYYSALVIISSVVNKHFEVTCEVY